MVFNLTKEIKNITTILRTTKYQWFIESTMRLDMHHAFTGDRTICARRISIRESREWCREEFDVDCGITPSKLLTIIFMAEKPKNIWHSSYKHIFFGLPFEGTYGSRTYTTQHVSEAEQHAEERANYLNDRMQYFI